jgi:hypothetical protein
MSLVAIDQYGHTYLIGKHPRKELLEQLGATHAAKMYCDKLDGSIQHTGYVICGLWLGVYRLSPAWPREAVL